MGFNEHREGTDQWNVHSSSNRRPRFDAQATRPRARTFAVGAWSDHALVQIANYEVWSRASSWITKYVATQQLKSEAVRVLDAIKVVVINRRRTTASIIKSDGKRWSGLILQFIVAPDRGSHSLNEIPNITTVSATLNRVVRGVGRGVNSKVRKLESLPARGLRRRGGNSEKEYGHSGKNPATAKDFQNGVSVHAGADISKNEKQGRQALVKARNNFRAIEAKNPFASGDEASIPAASKEEIATCPSRSSVLPH